MKFLTRPPWHDTTRRRFRTALSVNLPRFAPLC